MKVLTRPTRIIMKSHAFHVERFMYIVYQRKEGAFFFKLFFYLVNGFGIADLSSAPTRLYISILLERMGHLLQYYCPVLFWNIRDYILSHAGLGL